MDAGDAGFLQDSGAFFESGAGRGDIIDEPDAFPSQIVLCGGRVERECIAEILPAFGGASAPRLWKRETSAADDIGSERDLESGEEMREKVSGDFFGLVETAVALSPGVERDREDEIGEWEIRVVDAIREQYPERLCEIGDVFILEDVNGIGDDAFFVKNRYGKRAVERSAFPAGKTGRSVRSPDFLTDRAVVLEAARDGGETVVAEIRIRLSTVETGLRKKCVRDENSQFREPGRQV